MKTLLKYSWTKNFERIFICEYTNTEFIKYT